jgi:hypothetical protein
VSVLDKQAIAGLELRPYRRKPGKPISAVRLSLETEGFTYQKWGGEQTCKQGDWLVCSFDGETYTIDAETFAKTYEECGQGVFYKTQGVWAAEAQEPGAIETKEGQSEFSYGDFIVFNNQDRTDGYAMKRSKFYDLYQPSS